MLMLAGWINRHQQAVIAYQKEEIRVLREMLGGKRLRFTDEQRRRLALKAQDLSHSTLKELVPLVTPDTLCRWFRKYAGAKYDSSGMRRPGRPPKPQYIRDLVVRLAKENTSWGYTKLRDVMFSLGHEIGRTTVRRILAEDGIEPAPERRKHMPLGHVPESPLGRHRYHGLLQGGSDDVYRPGALLGPCGHGLEDPPRRGGRSRARSLREMDASSPSCAP